MRDPADIRTKKGTSLIVVVSRCLFALYFLFFATALWYNWLPDSALSLSWLLYIFVLYLLAEKFFDVFMQRGIDLSFAFPLLFSVYMVNFVSIVFKAQERFSLLNRAEHFTSFVLIGYVVWIFFLKYLPHRVWRRHPYYTALIVLSVTSFLGVANEIVELTLDGLFGTHYIGINRFDTPVDLLMNTLGTGLFLGVRLILNIYESKRHVKIAR